MVFDTLVKQNVSATAALATTRDSGNSRRRDPRAAPVSIHKNISIVETCRFYGVADSLTSCRVPRSCYDCLQLPHCLLSFDGICYDDTVSWLPQAHDAFSQAPVSVTTQPLVNNDPQAFFFGINTTYCSASDPICTDCRANFESQTATEDSRRSLEKQYCLGVNKCVCLGVCEVPAVWATRSYDLDCREGAPLYVNPQRFDLPPTSSILRDPRAPSQQLVQRQKPDTCEFYSTQDVQGCRVPRSCRDCLETEGCMVFNNKCVSMNDYDVMLDYRNATRPDVGYVTPAEWNGSEVVFKEPYLCSPMLQFPSTNTAYCPLSDETCAKCRANFAHAHSSNVLEQPRACYWANTTYCVGSGGCVCIEQCEDEMLTALNSQDDTCRPRKVELGVRAEVLIPAIATVFAMILGFSIWRLIRSRPVGGYRQAAREATVTVMRHMIDQAPNLHLDLYGWRQFQERLYQKEHELLSGAENVSPVSRPVDFEFAGATAPDFEEDDSSAPTATDPHALASAPVHWGASYHEPEDPSIPTAPDLTDL